MRYSLIALLGGFLVPICGTSAAAVVGQGAPPIADSKAAPVAASEAVVWPDAPGGRCAAAFFEAFNSGVDDQVRDFEQHYRAASALAQRPMKDRIEQVHMIRADLGNLTPLRLVSSSATELTVLARATQTGEELTMIFQFEEPAPHGLIALRITGSLPPEANEKAAEPIDEAARQEAIGKIGEALRDGYVYPEVGTEMAKALAKNEADGRYQDVKSVGELARRLNADLFAICKDRHFAVEVAGGPRMGGRCAPGINRLDGLRPEQGYGFRKVEFLPGNIGYIKFDGFDPSERAKETAAAALAFVAECDALIFDLRENHGGSPEMIRFISSYLFDQPTHLNDFYDRLSNKSAETWTTDAVPGKRFANDLPVYILTSSQTVSAAEEFTYNLKNLGRATIVGETTVGAAHLTTERAAGGRLVVRVPYARAYNPITKKNWEGVGVTPDIEAPAAEALDAACKDAIKKLSARK